jgi:uncharacterized protein (DUF433 family)
VRTFRSSVSNLSKIQNEEALVSEGLMYHKKGLVINYKGQLLDLSRNQTLMREIVEKYLSRVEFGKDRIISSFYPIVRTGDVQSPKHVAIDPRVCFGRPYLKEIRVPVDTIGIRVMQGEEPQSLAEDYDCKVEIINEGLRAYNLILKAAA